MWLRCVLGCSCSTDSGECVLLILEQRSGLVLNLAKSGYLKVPRKLGMVLEAWFLKVAPYQTPHCFLGGAGKSWKMGGPQGLVPAA